MCISPQEESIKVTVHRTVVVGGSLVFRIGINFVHDLEYELNNTKMKFSFEQQALERWIIFLKILQILLV